MSGAGTCVPLCNDMTSACAHGRMATLQLRLLPSRAIMLWWNYFWVPRRASTGLTRCGMCMGMGMGLVVSMGMGLAQLAGRANGVGVTSPLVELLESLAH